LGYFILTVAIFVSNVVAALAGAPRLTGGADLVGIVIAFIGFYPLYGFVRQRRYNPRWLWLVLLAISVLGALAAVATCLFIALAQASMLAAAISLAMVGLCGPYLFALHQYVFRSPHIWQ
jgi:peptidoglycan biosynthesis protein MviN/MurJ (putative lipid II flippase)